MTRFDPWQNRPDRPLRQQRRRTSSSSRHLLVWLTIFAVLVVGYTYRNALAVAWRQVLAIVSAAEHK